ncbi:hypothetical protein FJZ36_06835 [Candidatus Poribacteria bacterium]|nr:hypothetical protein [Candidatus Poribacteria bacterium]
MDPLVSERMDELRVICRRRAVRRLWLFGSVVTGGFDQDRSDVDALVEFRRVPLHTRAESYFGLWSDLQRLFERRVDLVEDAAIQNPYFRRAVDSERVIVYDAEDAAPSLA